MCCERQFQGMLGMCRARRWEVQTGRTKRKAMGRWDWMDVSLDNTSVGKMRKRVLQIEAFNMLDFIRRRLWYLRSKFTGLELLEKIQVR